MITNAVCGIIRSDADGEYVLIGIYPCMWQETRAYEAAALGEERSDRAAIYIPDIEADIREGDYITRSAIPEIIDVSGMLSVTSITRHDYGSENLWHVRIKAG